MSGDSARQVSVAAFWSYAGAIVERIVRFVVFVVIARLVSPAEFGIVVLAALVASALQDLLDAGIGQALVRQDAADETMFDTGFWTIMISGLGVSAAVMAAAMLVHDPLARHVLQLLSLMPLVGSLGSVHNARLVRDLGFKALSARLVAASLISGAAGVFLAYAGAGAWALAVRALLQTFFQTLILWFLCPWRPTARFERQSLARLLPDSLRLMGSSILHQLNSRGFDLAAGLILGAVALASLRVAGQTVMLLVELSAGPITAVAFAALARHRDDRSLSEQTFVLLARTSSLLMFPAFFGLAAISADLFPLLFGSQWTGAAYLMPLLCLLAVPIHFQLMLMAALFASGRTDRMLHWQLAQAVATGLAILVGAPYGLTGIALAAVGHMYVLLPLGIFWLRRDTHIAPRLLARAELPSLGWAALMGGLVYLARPILARELEGVALVAALVAVGMAVTAAGLPLLAGSLFRDLRASFHPGREEPR